MVSHQPAGQLKVLPGVRPGNRRRGTGAFRNQRDCGKDQGGIFRQARPATVGFAGATAKTQRPLKKRKLRNSNRLWALMECFKTVGKPVTEGRCKEVVLRLGFLDWLCPRVCGPVRRPPSVVLYPSPTSADSAERSMPSVPAELLVNNSQRSNSERCVPLANGPAGFGAPLFRTRKIPNMRNLAWRLGLRFSPGMDYIRVLRPEIAVSAGSVGGARPGRDYHCYGDDPIKAGKGTGRAIWPAPAAFLLLSVRHPTQAPGCFRKPHLGTRLRIPGLLSDPCAQSGECKLAFRILSRQGVSQHGTSPRLCSCRSQGRF